MKITVSNTVLTVSLALLSQHSFAQEKISPFASLLTSSQKKKSTDFQLATSTAAAPIYLDGDDFPVVRIAAEALSGDIEQVTGARPVVREGAPTSGSTAVIVGTLGQSKLIDDLVERKKIDVSKIRGQWETFVVTTVANPMPGVAQALVIAGSDRRGTAFGIFSLSESIGVSPWVWWADAKPAHRDSLVISNPTYNSKRPSVKYRGIFINDEDWGLQPWAAKTFETDSKDIGPKTYAKVCELLLRLKANHLWPGMHPSTKAFNNFPENRVVADRYAIVMGSSHAEPMLRNNVDEWKAKTMGPYNYVSNREQVLKYWDTRAAENGKYENIFTLGMRGIHDSEMEGGGTPAEQVKLLEDIFAQQRAILAKRVDADVTKVPQVFVPYKEVLGLYQQGLKVPDDVTLMWVDDNNGYMRQLSNPAEEKRSGGSGVYYHFSVWGAPQDFLWLGSSAPALTAYEMGKAYAYGADRVWMFNVGDIKPIEKEMDFGLRLAYDIDSYPVGKANDYLKDWANATFGSANAAEISGILQEYYRLTLQARPEHADRVQFAPAEEKQRLESYAAITRRAQTMYERLPEAQKSAFFQLVLYPVQGADAINRKWTYSWQGNAAAAVAAYDEIQRLTARYNNEISGGKWKHMMDANPRNRPVFAKPDTQKIGAPTQQGKPLFEIEPKTAQLKGEMKLIDGMLVPSAPGQLTAGNGNTATLSINSPTAQKATLYFRAQCLDEHQDSWFVALSGKEVAVNDNITGSRFKWFKIMDADLKAGANSLVITQREFGAKIQKIVLMKPGTVPAEPQPDLIIPAAKYKTAKNTADSKWQKIEGLISSGTAMTLLPYKTPSIAEADLKKAPSLSYTFQGRSTGCVIETRLLPTHAIHSQVKLRYAIQVDGGPAQIHDVEAPEWSGVWNRNVLEGYIADVTSHSLKNGGTHTVTISFLDPGLVLNQVRVFLDGAKG